MRTEIMELNKEREVSLTCYLQDVAGEFRHVKRRPAVLILPGGAYYFCSERECDIVAFPYLKAGYQAFILRYSVRDGAAAWPNPLEDYEQAMALIRSRADDWTLFPDRIAVIGFSAGGHLAAAAATIAKNKPNAAILGYAVTTADVKGCNPSAPDLIGSVDENTCPCFLFATRNDNVVPVMNTVRFIEALTLHDISYECHIYSHGPHGVSTADSAVQPIADPMSERVPYWVGDSIGWLKEVFGDFGDGGLLPPAVKPHISADYDPTLSVDCTLKHILAIPAGKAIGEQVLAQMKTALGEGAGEQVDAGNESLLLMKLRDILNFGKIPQETIDSLDAQLRQIPNG